MSGESVARFEAQIKPHQEKMLARNGPLPQMTFACRELEEAIRTFIIGCPLTKYTDCRFGSGIIVATDKQGRVFKIELSQVAGPE